MSFLVSYFDSFYHLIIEWAPFYDADTHVVDVRNGENSFLSIFQCQIIKATAIEWLNLVKEINLPKSNY